MADPKIKSCTVSIKYTATDGYRAEVGYGSNRAPAGQPEVALLGAFEELSRILHLFGFGYRAMTVALEAGERVAAHQAARQPTTQKATS